MLDLKLACPYCLKCIVLQFTRLFLLKLDGKDNSEVKGYITRTSLSLNSKCQLNPNNGLGIKSFQNLNGKKNTNSKQPGRQVRFTDRDRQL